MNVSSMTFTEYEGGKVATCAGSAVTNLYHLVSVSTMLWHNVNGLGIMGLLSDTFESRDTMAFDQTKEILHSSKVLFCA